VTATRPTADPVPDLDVLLLILTEPTLSIEEARRELGLSPLEDAAR
jgi:hypothetical protein